MLEAIASYRIRRKIGEGGMGVVYEAWDSRLERAVAIKTLREPSGTKDTRSRLWREARALARVNSPRVCQIFDVLEHEDGLVVVLELLNGESLAQCLLRGALATRQAVDIERQILEGLQTLHELNIVHRDLKPSNVFLTPHGVKLLDFGLARDSDSIPPANSDETVATLITAPGVIVGTPHYMAPEQATGSAIGPAADVFACGCIFYEMLAGTKSFAGTSFVDVLYAVLHHDPPPLTGSREVELLDRVIRKALSKRLESRYPSAHRMLEAIDAISLSRDDAPAVQTRTVTRLIALPFRLPKKNEEIDFLGFSLPDAISSSLSGIDGLIVRSSLVAERFADAPDPKRIAVDAEVDAILTGSVLPVGNQIRLSCQLIEALTARVIWSTTVSSSMEDLFKIQDELCQQIVRCVVLPLNEREHHILRRDVPGSAKSYEYYLRANQISSTRSLENIRLARDLYLQSVQEGPDYAPAWAQLGRAYRLIEKFGDDVQGDLQRTDDAFQRAFTLNPDLTIAHNFYTSVECDRGRSRSAMLRLLERARFRRNDPDLFAGLVQACRYCGELTASIAAHHRARHLDPNILTSAAHTYFLLGDYAKALKHYPSGYYLDCAALSALGEDKTALARLRDREGTGGATGGLRAIMQSLRAYLEGDFPECTKAAEIVEHPAHRDPEVFFYLARHLARVNEPQRAVALLSKALDAGFLWGPAVRRDPWFASLTSSADYIALLRAADEKSAAAHASFLEVGGDQVLDIIETAST